MQPFLSLTLALSLNPRFTSFLPVPSITVGNVTSTWDLHATLAAGCPPCPPQRLPSIDLQTNSEPVQNL